MFNTYYCVQEDSYAGYGACVKYWWWPFWKNFDKNTSRTREGAWLKAYNHAHKEKITKTELLKGKCNALPLL